jgi:predicted kinase
MLKVVPMDDVERLTHIISLHNERRDALVAMHKEEVRLLKAEIKALRGRCRLANRRADEAQAELRACRAKVDEPQGKWEGGL